MSYSEVFSFRNPETWTTWHVIRDHDVPYMLAAAVLVVALVIGLAGFISALQK